MFTGVACHLRSTILTPTHTIQLQLSNKHLKQGAVQVHTTHLPYSPGKLLFGNEMEGTYPIFL